jgi:hypothetical protein
MVRKLRNFAKDKQGVVYVWAMLIIGVILIAGFWYVMHYTFWFFEPATKHITEQWNVNSSMYYQVDSFFQGYENYAAILALICLGLAGFVYSQRKGNEV